jgi:hypothetical protein
MLCDVAKRNGILVPRSNLLYLKVPALPAFILLPSTMRWLFLCFTTPLLKKYSKNDLRIANNTVRGGKIVYRRIKTSGVPCPTEQCAKWTPEPQVATAPVVRYVMGSYTHHSHF